MVANVLLKNLSTESRRSLMIEQDGQDRYWRHITKRFILILLFGLACKVTFSQTLVRDSLMIYMGPVVDMHDQSFSIDTVLDRRKEPGPLIGTYEVNKYLFIPVDLLIVTDRPLKEKITAGFPPSLGKRSIR